MDDENAPRRKVVHDLGQDLSLLSVEELSERIAALEEEIGRLRQAMAAKQASRDAADLFFKR